MIKEVAQLIEDNTAFVIGDDLFVGHRPQDAPARCSVLLERSGGIENFFLTDKVAWALQVLSRAETYMNARDDALLIHAFLHGAAGWTLPVLASGDTYILETSEAQAYPASIGQDEKGYFEFSTNYILRLRNV